MKRIKQQSYFTSNIFINIIIQLLIFINSTVSFQLKLLLMLFESTTLASRARCFIIINMFFIRRTAMVKRERLLKQYAVSMCMCVYHDTYFIVRAVCRMAFFTFFTKHANSHFKYSLESCIYAPHLCSVLYTFTLFLPGCRQNQRK